MPGKLYVVATPIGNLEDMSPRAARILAEADLVAAEDTRVSGLLLDRFGVRAKLISCHKFNERARLEPLLHALLEGRSVALISDAGTPASPTRAACSSRPRRRRGRGRRRKRSLRRCDRPLRVGLPLPAFYVHRLSAAGEKQLHQALAAHAESGVPVLVAYESPNRILAAMAEIAQALPDSRVCLCNDLTKRYERVYRGGPAEVLQQLEQNPGAAKGEYTVVLYCEALPAAQEQAQAGLSPEAALTELVATRGLSSRGRRRARGDVRHAQKEAYAASLRLKRLFADGEP